MQAQPITLKTLPYVTAQEVFNTVSRHLLAQGQRSRALVTHSRGDLEECQYHTQEGLKDACGCLMADDEYDASLEGKTWQCLAKAGTVPSENADLIYKLQGVHDHYYPYEWKMELRKVAQAFNIDTAFLETLELVLPPASEQTSSSLEQPFHDLHDRVLSPKGLGVIVDQTGLKAVVRLDDGGLFCGLDTDLTGPDQSEELS